MGNKTMSPEPVITPSAKAKRYDRQLRLWGDHGQTALENAKVCVINATATATEVLKNIVLPGVGSFTILDDHMITPKDVGNNFFLTQEQIGACRGQIAKELLIELNPEVKGYFLNSSISKTFQDDPHFFKSFSLVIFADAEEENLKMVSSYLWSNNIPLIQIKSYGFLGFIRLQIKEHGIVESHPANEKHDLRIDVPFPALKEHLDSIDLSKLSKNAHMHVPYVVILYKKLLEWKEKYGSDRPQNYKEKLVFKDLIRDGILKNEEGIPEDEENFEEALKATNTKLESTKLTDNAKLIFNDAKCINLTIESEDFWFLARAVKEFTVNEGNGLLPVSGSIPDMFSDSDSYIKLQSIYKEKANQDYQFVLHRVHELLKSVGRKSDSIDKSFVKTFCKEASNLRLIRGSCIADDNTANWDNLIEQSDSQFLAYYMILKGVDRFRKTFKRYPGISRVKNDLEKLKASIADVLKDYKISDNEEFFKDEYIQEVCRYGGSELHAMAAFIGGCASQEIIKILTKQYVPTDNLFIFNTMNSKTVQIKI